MFSLNDKVSIRQLQILMILDIFGTGILILPRRAAEFAAQDGWVVILLSTIIALMGIYAISSLAKLFPGKSFYEYTTIITMKPIALILSLGFIIRILLNMAFELRIFGEIVKQVLLNNTPFWVICLLLLAISAFAAAKGYETRARIAEILVLVIFIPLAIVFAIGCADIDFTNILPLFKSTAPAYMKGGFYCFSAFTGMELLLHAFPYIKSSDNIKKGAFQVILIIGILMTLITFIVIARFGPINVTRQLWPVLEMMDTIDIPGSFLERQEALIMSFWIISVFAIVNAGLFFTAVISKSIVKKGKHIFYIIGGVVLTFLLTLIPGDMGQIYQWMDIMFITFGISYMLLIPVILLVIAKLRGISGNVQ